MPKFRIIVNPTSNKGATAKEIPDIQKHLDAYKLDYDIVLTAHPWHAAELTEKAILEGVEHVVAAGGDGTANEVLNGIMIARKAGLGDTIMGVLPVGRGNDFAFGMGIHTDLDEACKALAEGPRQKIDVGRITGELYPEGRYFGNGVGIGFDAMVGFIAAEQIITGFLGYLVAAIRTMFIYHPAPVMEIKIDNSETLTRSCLMISIMNGIRMGGGFMMAPLSHKDDGLLDLCIVDEVSRPNILRIMPLFFKGTQGTDPAVSFRQGSKVVVKAIKGTLPCHADGETICTMGKEVNIELFPQCVTLITGAGKEAE